MLRRDIISAAVTIAAYFGYYGFADLRDRRWAYYVAAGVLTAWVGWCWRQDGVAQGRPLLAFTGALLIIEGVQQAGCGALRWQSMLPGDLCVQVFGDTIYAALASLALAAAWTWRAVLWPTRPPAR